MNNKNIGLKVLAGNGAQIDMSTANGKLIFGIFAALARGKKKVGRPRKMDITTIKMAMLAMSKKMQ